MKMRLRISRIFATAVVCALARFACADVMLWTVDENATVDDAYSVMTFLSPVPDDDLHNPAARVKVSGGGLAEPVYLDNFFQEDPDGPYMLDEGGGYYGVWAGDPGSGHYGVMIQQSHLPTELAMEALFSIEIGQMNWDDDTYMSGAFQVLAESDKYTYEQVLSHTYEIASIAPPVTDWKPMNYYSVGSVPEPSSGLLAAVGLCVLALRRRRA